MISHVCKSQQSAITFFFSQHTSIPRDDADHMMDLPLLPVCIQSTPSREFPSFSCRLLTVASVSIGLRPEFSASAIGTLSKASANARIAYCSRPGDLRAASSTASEQAISAAPPPYTILLSRTKLRTTHRASCRERFASSMI